MTFPSKNGLWLRLIEMVMLLLSKEKQRICPLCDSGEARLMSWLDFARNPAKFSYDVFVQHLWNALDRLFSISAPVGNEASLG